MIFFVLVLIFASVFIGLNINNTCTIWFIKNFENVHVFLIVFIALGVGILLMLPFCFSRLSHKSKKMKEEKELSSKTKKTKAMEKSNAAEKARSLEKSSAMENASVVEKASVVETHGKVDKSSNPNDKKDNVVHLV